MGVTMPLPFSYLGPRMTSGRIETARSVIRQSKAMQVLRTAAGRVGKRFSARPDSEHEQSTIRAVIVFFVLLYYAVVDWMQPDQHSPLAYLTIMSYLAIAVVILAWIAWKPAISPPRRVLGIIGDLSAISVLMAQVGTPATPLYPLYLWIILGNGFRYGLTYMMIAVAVGLVGFGTVVLTTEPWRTYPELASGLLLGLVAIPAYTATLIRKLTEAKAEAEAANAAKSRFLATVSHEFRTPLNAIIGMTRVLEEKIACVNAEGRDAARTIHTAAESLRFLVEDTLDLSRLEAGKIVITKDDVHLHRALAETAAVLAPEAEEKGLRFAVALDAAVPVLARVDWPHVRQIVINIIANAIKFTDSGHVLVRMSTEVRAKGGTRLLIAVEDTGPGIPPAMLEHVFEPFAQADEGVNRRFGGSGLGLAISRQLAEAMGGCLEAESTENVGSRFVLSVPLDPAADARPAPSGPVLADPAAASLLAAAGVAHEYVTDCHDLEAKAHPASPVLHGLSVDPAVAEAAARHQASRRRPVISAVRPPAASGPVGRTVVHRRLTQSSGRAVDRVARRDGGRARRGSEASAHHHAPVTACPSGRGQRGEREGHAQHSRESRSQFRRRARRRCASGCPEQFTP